VIASSLTCQQRQTCLVLSTLASRTRQLTNEDPATFTTQACFYRTQYGYDTAGRQDYVKDAVGTITRTAYDALGRVVETWAGTNDQNGAPRNGRNGRRLRGRRGRGFRHGAGGEPAAR
jgi:hypothetical protein